MVAQDVTLSCYSEDGRVMLLHIEAEAEAESRESPDEHQKLLTHHGSNKGLANEDTISFRHALNVIQSQKLSDRSIVLKILRCSTAIATTLTLSECPTCLRIFAALPSNQAPTRPSRCMLLQKSALTPVNG